MILTPWLLEPLYKQKKVRLSAITSFEKSVKMSSDTDVDETQILLPSKKKEVSRNKLSVITKRDRFNEAVCGNKDYNERELLWDQLEKIPLSIRNIAEKFLVYLVINQKDNLLIRPNGRIIVNGHEIPGSNISKILTNILSNRSKVMDSGELAVLTLLKHLPVGLYNHISKSKRKWCLNYENKKRPMPSSARMTAIPVKSKDKLELITGNPKDGVLITPDMRPKMGPSLVLPDTLKIKGVKSTIKPVQMKQNEKHNLDEWYKCLDLSLNN